MKTYLDNRRPGLCPNDMSYKNCRQYLIHIHEGTHVLNPFPWTPIMICRNVISAWSIIRRYSLQMAYIGVINRLNLLLRIQMFKLDDVHLDLDLLLLRLSAVRPLFSLFPLCPMFVSCPREPPQGLHD